MWLGRPDPEVLGNGEFDQGRHHRADRSEEQGHRTGRFLGEAARRSRARLPGSLITTESAATSRRSIPRTAGTGNDPIDQNGAKRITPLFHVK